MSKSTTKNSSKKATRTVVIVLIAAALVAFLAWFVPSYAVPYFSSLTNGGQSSVQKFPGSEQGSGAGAASKDSDDAKTDGADAEGQDEASADSEGLGADGADNSNGSDDTGAAAGNAGTGTGSNGQTLDPTSIAASDRPANAANIAKANASGKNSNASNANAGSNNAGKPNGASKGSNNSGNSSKPAKPSQPTKPATYTISYDLAGGALDTSAGNASLPTSFTQGDAALTLPSNLTRAGYTFEGWTSSTDRAGADPKKNVTIASANSNLRYTAHWKPVQYQITYNLDGGSLGAAAANLPTSYTVESNTLDITLPTAPTKANYKFYRWENALGQKVTTLSIPKGSMHNISVTAKWMTPLDVEYVKEHTPQEIADYIAASGFNASMPDGDTSSDFVSGNMGSVSKAVQDNAIAGLNIIRFIAGVNPVTFSQSAYELAQAGAAYMAYTGDITHNPSHSRVPDAPDDVFNKASHGCGESNIVAGTGLANVAIGSFVPDPGNVGTGEAHRRYCLNPALKTVAFGAATHNGQGGRTMYVMGENAPWNQHFTVWPSANVPIEYFPKANGTRTYWTVCIHRGRLIQAQAANIRVTLKYDGKTVVFRPGQGDCSYNNGSIMFRPDRDVKAGDVFEVKVEGVTDSQGRPLPIEYTVHFFSLKDYPASAKAQVMEQTMAADLQVKAAAGVDVDDESATARTNVDADGESTANSEAISTGATTSEATGEATGEATLSFAVASDAANEVADDAADTTAAADTNDSAFSSSDTSDTSHTTTVPATVPAVAAPVPATTPAPNTQAQAQPASAAAEAAKAKAEAEAEAEAKAKEKAKKEAEAKAKAEAAAQAEAAKKAKEEAAQA